MNTQSFVVNVSSDEPPVVPLEATCSFDPDVWLIAWADMAGSQTVVATVSGIDFNGQVPTSVKLNGLVTPTSSSIVNDELILQFNRKDAVASYQTPPLPGRISQTIQGEIASGYFTAQADVFFVSALNVTIDIKPGAFPNSINLGSNGNVPVAILGSPTFDASTVDPLTVTLADASVRVVGKKGKLQASLDDVNGDGLTDLMVHIDTTGLQLTDGDVEAVLKGKTYSGEPIVGMDTIRIVP